MLAKHMLLPIVMLSSWANAQILTHHYDFNGSAVIDSVGGANGTLMGGATVEGGSVRFDGIDDYVQFGENIIPTDRRFILQLVAQELTANPYPTELISQGWSGPAGFYFGYAWEHNVRIGDMLQNTPLPFPDDRLPHSYTIIAGGGLDTYFLTDGFLIETFKPIHVITGGSKTRLGRQFDPAWEFFHGSIDELSVWDAVPEPATTALLGLGLFAFRRKR